MGEGRGNGLGLLSELGILYTVPGVKDKTKFGLFLVGMGIVCEKFSEKRRHE